MGLLVNTHCGLDIRRIDQAEPCPSRMVEPVGEKLHPVLTLNFEILAVRLGYVARGQTAQIMSIQINRHLNDSSNGCSDLQLAVPSYLRPV
jgi:hypothetical protein